MALGYSASASSGASGGKATGQSGGNQFGAFNYNAPSSQAIGATKWVVIALAIGATIVGVKYFKGKK